MSDPTTCQHERPPLFCLAPECPERDEARAKVKAAADKVHATLRDFVTAWSEVVNAFAPVVKSWHEAMVEAGLIPKDGPVEDDPRMGADEMVTVASDTEMGTEYLMGRGHRIQLGGTDGDGFCYEHQSFDCLEEINAAEADKPAPTSWAKRQPVERRLSVSLHHYEMCPQCGALFEPDGQGSLIPPHRYGIGECGGSLQIARNPGSDARNLWSGLPNPHLQREARP